MLLPLPVKNQKCAHLWSRSPSPFAWIVEISLYIVLLHLPLAHSTLNRAAKGHVTVPYSKPSNNSHPSLKKNQKTLYHLSTPHIPHFSFYLLICLPPFVPSQHKAKLAFCSFWNIPGMISPGGICLLVEYSFLDICMAKFHASASLTQMSPLYCLIVTGQLLGPVNDLSQCITWAN